MKVKYEFLDGTCQEIDINSGELGELLLELERAENLCERRETRRHTSLNSLEYEGDFFASDADTESQAFLNTDIASLYKAMESLSPEQMGLINKIFYQGLSISEVAELEGVSHVAIVRRLSRIYKRLQKKL